MIQRLLKRKEIDGAKILLEEVLNGNISFKSYDILSCLKSGYPQMEFLALKIIKRFPHEFEKKQIKEVLQLNDKELDSFLSNVAVDFQFPIVNGKDGKLANGIAIELDGNRVISNKRNISGIPFLKKGCIVFFDSDFEGSSFQASLLIALYLRNYPENLLFTGAVKSDGTISANMVEAKKELAERNGKILISGGNIVKLAEILKENRIRIPFLISTDCNKVDLRKLAKSAGTDIDTICQLASISEEELLLSIPKYLDLSENWNDYILTAIESLRKIKSSVESHINVPTFHIALRMPSSLAMGIGASIGTGKLPIALYHYDPVKGYLKLINLIEKSRTIKRKIDKFKEITVRKESFTGNSTGCVIGIRLASHSPEGKPLKNLVSSVKGDLFLIEHQTYTGNLPVNADWTGIVAELRTAIEEIHKNYSEIHIVMSVPVIIAFALGMALGHYWNVNLYQFDTITEKYCKVLNLKDIQTF